MTYTRQFIRTFFASGTKRRNAIVLKVAGKQVRISVHEGRTRDKVRVHVHHEGGVSCAAEEDLKVPSLN